MLRNYDTAWMQSPYLEKSFTCVHQNYDMFSFNFDPVAANRRSDGPFARPTWSTWGYRSWLECQVEPFGEIEVGSPQGSLQITFGLMRTFQAARNNSLERGLCTNDPKMKPFQGILEYDVCYIFNEIKTFPDIQWDSLLATFRAPFLDHFWTAAC